MDWELVGEQVIAFGIRILVAILILGIGRWLAHWVSGVLERLMNKAKVDQTLVGFLKRLSFIGMMVFVGLAALAQLGVQTTSFIAVLGAAGLAVGLALQGTLSNFAAGVMLILFRPFEVGDLIVAGGEKGKVKAIQIFNTHMLTPDNVYLIVPNSQVLSGSIWNYNRMPTRRVDLVIGVGYDDDLNLAKQTILEVLENHPGVLKDPAPVVAVSELADSSVNFVVRPWCKTEDYWKVHFDCTQQIKEALDAKGLSIPYPQQDVHVVSGNGGQLS